MRRPTQRSGVKVERRVGRERMKMNTLFGMKVMTSALVRPVPVLQLSPDFNACTDTFKAEINQWLLEMFGTQEVMYMIGKDTLVLNQSMLAKIKQSIPNHWTAPNMKLTG